MRWKKYLTISEIDELVNIHKINGLQGPDIVTAINNTHRKEYNVNIVLLFKRIAILDK